MLTAEQLKITPAELVALLWVRNSLADGTIVHRRDVKPLSSPIPPGVRAFNMGVDLAGGTSDCGTTCCIGGWMALHMSGFPACSKTMEGKVNRFMYGGGYGEAPGCSIILQDLFFPSRSAMADITEGQAVKTIDHFLETGVVEWGGF